MGQKFGHHHLRVFAVSLKYVMSSLYKGEVVRRDGGRRCELRARL